MPTTSQSLLSDFVVEVAGIKIDKSFLTLTTPALLKHTQLYRLTSPVNALEYSFGAQRIAHCRLSLIHI